MIARMRVIGLLTGFALVLAALMPAGAPGVAAAPLAALTQTAEPPTLTPIPPSATPMPVTATPDLPPRPDPTATATATATAAPPEIVENDRPRSTPTPTRTVGPIQVIPLPSAIARDAPPSPTAEVPPASGEETSAAPSAQPAQPGTPAQPAVLPSTGTIHTGSPTALFLIGLALIALSLGLRRRG